MGLKENMAADTGRNFRSYYYEKVGFRGVEEKKSLEILLKDQPLDVIKLKQFCLRFPVPAIHRIRVWKILLGILPTYTENHQWTWDQRQMQFNDLTHALEVMGHTTTVPSPAEKLLLVWLLDNRCLHFDYQSQLLEPSNQCKLAILNTLLKLFEQEVDCYWLARGIFLLSNKFEEEKGKFKEQFKHKLEAEDSILYKHLISLDTLDHLPLERWFQTCFAGFINETSLVRFWDKLLTGTGASHQLLVFVAVALLVHFRRPILQTQSNQEICQCISNVAITSAESVVTDAIELWQRHGVPTAPPSSEPTKQK